MRKSFLFITTLLLSSMLFLSSFGLSHADSDLPTTYKITSDATIYDEGISTSKHLGTLKKGTEINIKAFEKNSTGSWWCKINSGKYKGEWVYSGSINFPYAHVTGTYYASKDRPCVYIHENYLGSSRKTGTLSPGADVYIKKFEKNSKGNWWGKVDFGWVYMGYMNFSGRFKAPNKDVPIHFKPSKDSKKTGTIKDKTCSINRIELNNEGNWWCRIASGSHKGNWIYLGNLKHA